MTNSIGEIEDAGVLLVIGSNTTETHPVIGYRMKMAKKKGAALIVVDPRQVDLAEHADLFLQLRPGTNEALLNGLIHVIIEEGLADEDFIRERTVGYAEMAAAVKKYTPGYVEEITGVAAEDIRRAARLYAQVESAAIFYTMGITQHSSGTNNVLAVANLAMVSGNVGKRSAGVNPLRGQNNVQGACDMGALPNVVTGYQRLDNRDTQSKFKKDWGVKLPVDPGLTVTEIIDGILDGGIKVLYVMGENPALSDANLSHVMEALAKVDFLVVQDIFLTETAALADVVLPAAAFAEKWGTFTNTERRVQLVRQAVNPPGEARADWVILHELASRLGLKWNYGGPEEIFQEITRLTPSYAGISYKRLEEEGGLQWPCPEAGHPGTPYLHVKQFSSGKGYFTPVEYQPPAEEPDAEYPLLLTTGRNLFHYHTGTMTRRSSAIGPFKPEEMAQISKEDAKKLGVGDGDLVKISSRRGEVKVKVQVTEIVPPGVVFMTFHFHEAAVNLLTNNKVDPVAKIPEYKVCAVKLEKAVP
jgi:formate dehydrogenase alpha subunit